MKHYGWAPPGRPLANLVNEPGLRVRDAVCRRSVSWLLEANGLTSASVDVVAVNGIPYRLRGARQCVRRGRHVFVPHHLAHAALAARIGPYASCNVLTVDGRGEYETAAFFTYREGELTRVAELSAGDGCSIGGAYETVTRVLGFGSHGQGQTMALASFAEGDAATLAAVFSARGFDDHSIDERALQELARRRVPEGTDVDDPRAHGLAADAQAALESVVVALARDGQRRAPHANWACAGGVALNCAANSVLRDALGVDLWVPSSAHDGGTALGAALEAAHWLGEPPAQPIRSAGLGPRFEQARCLEALDAAGFAPDSVIDGVAEASQRLADGQVIGWFRGGAEYGPRALGQRSIVAHPGRAGVQDRVNAIKQRQRWRPFGPSVLREHALTWFGDDRFGPFMTFTTDVRPELRDRVAGVVHVDGSTRPQPVDEHSDPEWRRLIEGFYELTGIPMVLNTSFNGRAQPIVTTPEEALATARRLGLDALCIEGLLVDLREVRS